MMRSKLQVSIFRELEADQIVISGVHEMLNSFLDAAMQAANSQVRNTLNHIPLVSNTDLTKSMKLSISMESRH
jgi:hypothetical protein